MGGVVSAISNAVSDVGQAIGDVAQSVGGAVEQAKRIGSKVDTTKNNIGVCQITFTTEKGYS